MPTSPLEPTSAFEPLPLFSHPLASAVRAPRHQVVGRGGHRDREVPARREGHRRRGAEVGGLVEGG